MMIQEKKSKKSTRWKKRVVWIGACLFTLVLVGVVALVVTLKIGVSSHFLAIKIQDSLNVRFGEQAKIDVSNAYLVLDEHFHLHLESRDVALQLKSGNVQIGKIGRIRIAVAIKALLRGELHLTQLRVSDVDVRLAGGQGGSFLARLPQDGAGRVDFDAISNLIFDALAQGAGRLERQNFNDVTVEKIRFYFPFRGKDKQLDLIQLTLERVEGYPRLSGVMQFDGQNVQFEGQAFHDEAAGKDTFHISLNRLPLYLGVAEGNTPYWEDGTVRNGHFRLKGLSDMQISGSKTRNSQKIRLKVGLPQGEVELADMRDLPASGVLNLIYERGQAGISITNTQVTVGRMRANIRGSLMPLTLPDLFGSSEPQDLLSDSEIIARFATMDNVEGKYGFELFFDEGSISSPSLPDIHFSAQTRGVLETFTRKVIFDSLSLLTNEARLDGQGSLRFAVPDQGQLFIGSQTPETIFDFHTSSIDADEIRQFWLFNIASASRRWFLQQIEAGKLLTGRLQINLPLDFYHQGKPRRPLSSSELKMSGMLKDVNAKLVGDLPALENFDAFLDIQGQDVVLQQGKAQIFLDKNATSHSSLIVEDVAVEVTRSLEKPAVADIRFQMKGEGADMLRLIKRDPIKAGEKLPFTPTDFSGQVQAAMHLKFPVIEQGQKLLPDQIDWSGQIDFNNVALTLALETGGKITNAQGQVSIDKNHFTLAATAKLDGMDGVIEMAGATQQSQARDEKITLILDDETRGRLLPALSPFISGKAQIEIGAEREGARDFDVDLGQAIVEVPWLGWKKGAGIAAKAQFTAYIDKANSKNIQLKNFSLKGETFQLLGEVDIRDGHLTSARFNKVSLNRGDDFRLSVQFEKGRYFVKVSGKKFDMRSFIKSVSATQLEGKTLRNEAVTLELDIGRVSGFYNEAFDNFKANFKRDRAGHEVVSLSAHSTRGLPLNINLNRQGKEGLLRVVSEDSGAFLRFADYYEKLYEGVLDLELQLDESGSWYGPLSLSNFDIVNEPRLARIVASPPPSGGKSLNDVAGGKINTSRLRFDRAFGQIVRGENFLMLDRAIVRGTSVGATFQGVVYDSAGNVSMTGTFMPAYGLNRVFSNVPILGNILGNGRDRGLIGITFKIDGKAKNPRIIVNPLSIIAPGVFRQIFEFHP